MAKRIWHKGILELWRVDMDYGKPSFHIFIGAYQVLSSFDGTEVIQALKFLRKAYSI